MGQVQSWIHAKLARLQQGDKFFSEEQWRIIKELMDISNELALAIDKVKQEIESRGRSL